MRRLMPMCFHQDKLTQAEASKTAAEMNRVCIRLYAQRQIAPASPWAKYHRTGFDMHTLPTPLKLARLSRSSKRR